ncbi:hypothetical protein HZA39_04000 [Candidatus Peregrinibacteria bacterium]|nr:hypothetical protein [Candidatus Peregrinibacteria bacterium]
MPETTEVFLLSEKHWDVVEKLKAEYPNASKEIGDLGGIFRAKLAVFIQKHGYAALASADKRGVLCEDLSTTIKDAPLDLTIKTAIQNAVADIAKELTENKQCMEAQRLFDDAKQEMHNKNPKLAYEILIRLIEFLPKNFLVIKRLSYYAALLGKFEESKKYAEMGLKFWPEEDTFKECLVNALSNIYRTAEDKSIPEVQELPDKINGILGNMKFPSKTSKVVARSIIQMNLGECDDAFKMLEGWEGADDDSQELKAWLVRAKGLAMIEKGTRMFKTVTEYPSDLKMCFMLDTAADLRDLAEKIERDA